LTDRSEPEFPGLSLGRLRDQAEEIAVVAAACDVGIFRALADEPASPEELAGRLELLPRPVGIVLPVLARLGLVTEGDDGRFRPTDTALRTLADPSSAEYQAEGLPHWLRTLRHFTRLPDALRSGGPIRDPEREREDADRGLARFMAAMNAAPLERVRRIVDLCLEGVPEAERALDLGGGPGHMSRELARRGLEVVLFDRPETVAFVGPEYGLDEVGAIRLEGGDFLEDPLPPGPFDVVLMSNILHIYGAERNRELLRKAAGVIRPGGIVAIAEFVRGPSSRAPRFGLVMLLRTEEGNAHAEEDYREWLRAAGFVDVRLADLDGERQLLTAALP